MKKRTLLSVILSLTLVLSLNGCGLLSGDSLLGDILGGQSSSTEESSNTKADKSSKTSVKSTSSSDTKKTSKSDSSDKKKSTSYSVKTSSGSTLEAKPGYTTISDSYSTAPADRHSASVLLPYIGDYINGLTSVGNEINYSSGTWATTFTFSSEPDSNSLKAYVEALSSYGCTIEETMGKGSYFLSCSKKVTHKLIPYDYLTKYYDLRIYTSNYDGKYYVTAEYPPEIWFDYSSVSAKSEGNEITVMTEIKYTNKKYYFYIKGFAGEGDSIVFAFDPNVYTKNDHVKLKDFAAQKSAGTSGLCYLSVKGNNRYLEYDDITDVDVKVEELSDSEIAISFKAVYQVGSTRHCVEGISVCNEIPGESVNSGGGYSSDSTSGLSIGIHDQLCTACGGQKMVTCRTCGGDGMEQCPNCGGTGKYYEMGAGTTPGGYQRCKRCDGKTSIKCSNSRCSGGRVPCSICGGTGKR